LYAIDVDTKECLAMASEGRSSFHAYVFLREVLSVKTTEVVVDRGFWYK